MIMTEYVTNSRRFCQSLSSNFISKANVIFESQNLNFSNPCIALEIIISQSEIHRTICNQEREIIIEPRTSIHIHILMIPFCQILKIITTSTKSLLLKERST